MQAVVKFPGKVVQGILGVLQEDSDKLLSYHTKQQVNVLDRSLGIINYMIQVGVMIYVVGFVFIYDQGYLEAEQSRGLISTQANGEAVSVSTGTMRSRFFANEEITYPTLEQGNVFVATRVEVTDENRGVCEDVNSVCASDADCTPDIGATCTENGMCLEPSWCPAVEDAVPEVFKLETSGFRIWVKSSILFDRIAHGKIYATDMSQPILYPEPGFNTFTVRDLLLLCDPPVRYEEVSELGAAIEVQFVWTCNIDNPFPCVPTIEARRIDVLLSETEIGFKFKKKMDLGEDSRRLETRHGIRFYFKTVGTGKKFSVSAMIFKISTGIALLGFSPIIADFMMLNCFKLSKKYEARKYIYSQDFSEYFESLEAQGKTGSKVDDEDDDDEDDEEENDEDEEWRRRMDEED